MYGPIFAGRFQRTSQHGDPFGWGTSRVAGLPETYVARVRRWCRAGVVAVALALTASITEAVWSTCPPSGDRSIRGESFSRTTSRSLHELAEHPR